MATFYSDQRTNTTAVPPVSNDAKNRGGRLRIARWTYTTPASAAPAVGDYIELCDLPNGAIILGGTSKSEAMSSAGGTAGYDIGYSGADTRYGATIDVDAAGSDDFANTIALNYGDELTAAKTIRAKITGEDWAVSKKFYGHILYVDQSS